MFLDACKHIAGEINTKQGNLKQNNSGTLKDFPSEFIIHLAHA